MNFSFTIGKKLALGFGTLAFAFIIFNITSYSSLQHNQAATSEITQKFYPSEYWLNELSDIVDQSTLIMKNRVFVESNIAGSDIVRMNKIITVDYPQIVSQLNEYKTNWDTLMIKEFNQIAIDINDSLFQNFQRINIKLNQLNAYQSTELFLTIQPLYIDNGLISKFSKQIINRISHLETEISELRQIKETEIIASHQNSSKISIIMGIAIIILAFMIALYIYNTLTKPIIFVKKELIQMSKGILIAKKIQSRTDEIGDMLVALKGLNKGLQKTSEFAREIGKGNYSVEYAPMSKDDQLGNSLIDLRNDLERATKDALERKEQDEIRNWTTQGLAHFSDILRYNNTNLHEFGQNIISNIVEYMKINQGGLYIYNDDDSNNPHLDLIAMYAFSRNKFANKKIMMGEGLIGIAFLEKQTIYMTDVPDSYIEITSGLGKANPTSILIVPLKIEENVLGIIELASFTEFKKHEITFIERVGESIAATLNNVRINNSTKKLLEQSKAQAEAMHAQEEEMRQNLEELQATQEEAARRKEEMEKTLLDAHLEIERLKAQISKFQHH